MDDGSTGDGVTGAFARATAVSRTGDGRYVAEVAEGLETSRDNANGGYLLAIGARAMCAEERDRSARPGHGDRSLPVPGRMGPIDVVT